MGSGDPVVLVLAGGRGERFRASGGAMHKLDAPLAGRSVLSRTLAAVAASGLPHRVVSPHPTRPGMGDSIAAGVRACADAPGWLVLPGDMPLVQPQTLQAVARALADHAVVAPHHRGCCGHPVGFQSVCGPDLMALSGDRGAASVRARWPCLNLSVDDEGVLLDIDTVDDLRAAERRWQQAERRRQGGHGRGVGADGAEGP